MGQDRVRIHVLYRDLAQGLSGVGQLAGQHLIHHHAQRIDVASGIRAVSSGLFRRDIVDGADGLAVILVYFIFQRGNTEVAHLDGAVPEQHNVLGLDIPVDDAPLMSVGKGLCDLLGKMQRLLPGEHAPPVHILLEGDAIDQFHNYVFDVITMAYIIHGDDIRVGKHGYGLRFRAETPAEFLVRRHLIPHDLYRHIAIQAVTHGFIDDGHSALADAL